MLPSGIPPAILAQKLRLIIGTTKRPTIAEVAKAVGCKPSDKCWPVVCHPASCEDYRFEQCPCKEKYGHRFPNDKKHRRPAALGTKVYFDLFGAWPEEWD